jgi:CheY-like chemotaxis protein
VLPFGGSNPLARKVAVVSLQGDSTDDLSSIPPPVPIGRGRRTRITVIDDAVEFLSLVTDVLEGTYDVTTSTGDDLDLEGLLRINPDLIVLDLRLKEAGEQLTGMELLRLIRAHRLLRFVPIVVCSADVAQLTLNREALAQVPRCWVLRKPFSLDEFEAMLAEALRSGGHGPDEPARSISG